MSLPRLTQICGGLPQQYRVIIKTANGSIAHITQQPAHLPGRMAMIGMKTFAIRTYFPTNSAYAILFLLYFQLILGLSSILVSAQHLDGEEMIRFMTWAQGIVTFQGGVADLILNAHIIFKLHLTLGMTLFLVFPFTRLVHVLSAPIWYLGRKGYQIVRTKGGS